MGSYEDSSRLKFPSIGLPTGVGKSGRFLVALRDRERGSEGPWAAGSQEAVSMTERNGGEQVAILRSTSFAWIRGGDCVDPAVVGFRVPDAVPILVPDSAVVSKRPRSAR